MIELTVKNWDEVYEDLSKRLKVKPQGGAVMSKHLKMAGQPSSPRFLSRGVYYQLYQYFGNDKKLPFLVDFIKKTRPIL